MLGPYVPDWIPGDDAATRQNPVAHRLKRSLRAAEQRYATTVLTSNPAAVEKVVARSRRGPQVHELPLGVDTRTWHPSSGNGVGQEVLFLANLDNRKGVHVLLDAFARLAPELPQARLVVAGGGPEAAEVGRRARSAALLDRVELVGHLDRPRLSRPGLRRLLPARLRGPQPALGARGDGLRKAGRGHRGRRSGLRGTRPGRAQGGSWQPCRSGERARCRCWPIPPCATKWAPTTAESSRSATPGRGWSTASRSFTGRQFVRLERQPLLPRLTRFLAQAVFNLLITHLPGHWLRLGWLRAVGADVGRGVCVFRGTTVIGAEHLVLGDRVQVGFRVVLDARGGLSIAEDVLLSSDTQFLTANHNLASADFERQVAPIVIADHAWIATRAVVLAGVTVGQGGVVAAGAVATVTGRLGRSWAVCRPGRSVSAAAAWRTA